MNEQLSALKPSHRDALRLAGAVVFAAGVLVLLFRKEEDWADFPVLLVLAIPCALLYGLGIGALRIGPTDDAEGTAARHTLDPATGPADHAGGATARHGLDRTALPAWRATALVLGIVFVALTVSQLVDTIGGDSDKSGWVFFIFLVTAAAAAYAAVVHGLRYGALLAGLALIISWVALWDALVEPSATTVRWLFLIVGVGLAVAALRLHARDRREAPELVTAAGIAGLAAGVTGLFALSGAFFGGALSAFGGEPDLSGGAQQGEEWNLFLLVLALALIWYGARAAWRGPAYVGALALAIFIFAAAADIASVFDGDEPGDGVVGWPLLLLVLGGAALAAGLLGGGGRPAATATGPTGTATGADEPTRPMAPPPPPAAPRPGEPPSPGPPQQ